EKVPVVRFQVPSAELTGSRKAPPARTRVPAADNPEALGIEDEIAHDAVVISRSHPVSGQRVRSGHVRGHGHPVHLAPRTRAPSSSRSDASTTVVFAPCAKANATPSSSAIVPAAHTSVAMTGMSVSRTAANASA